MKKNTRRNRTAQIRRQQETRQKGEDQVKIYQELNRRLSIMQLGLKMNAADSFSNKRAFLGGASPIFPYGTFERTNLTKNTELLTAAYRTSALVSRFIDTPAEDMTRTWYTLTADFEKGDIAELRKLEARHSIRQELTDAIRWARLYGGSLALMVIRGEAEKLDKPLDLDLLPPDCFQGLQVLDRAQGISPSLELVTDLDDPDYGLPIYYTVNMGTEENGQLKLHHTRVLRFVSRELNRTEMVAENFFGVSELEHMWDSIIQYETVTASIAELIHKANISTLKLGEIGDMYAIGTDETRAKIDTILEGMTHQMTNHGILLLSQEDSLERHAYSFDGLKDIHEACLLDVAGAAEIPMTKLFGRAPAGMNATGESDMRNYYEMISGLQERMLRPALERLLPVMTISCWGYLPKNLDFIFNPLATTTPEQAGAIIQGRNDAIERAFRARLITRKEARAEMRSLGDKYAIWTNLTREGDEKTNGKGQ